MHASLAILTLLSANHEAPKLEVQFRPIANLTYQLDVVTEQLPYDASANFKKLWDDRFLKSEEDRAMVRRWKEKRTELRNRSEPGAISRVFFPIEWMGPRADGESRVRGAGFDATNLADYGTRIRKETPEAGPELENVATYFLPRFEEWWKADAAASGESYASEMRQLLDTPNMRKSFGDFISFYKAQLGPNPSLPLVLLYRPGEIREPTSGQQLGQYSVVQFLTSEKPEHRIDVVLHELSHYLYGRAAPENLAKLQERFLALKRPTAIPAFNLLNEGLATALGNGVIAEQFEDPARFQARLKQPRSFYNDAAIDAAGKAVFGWIKPYIAKGGSLYDTDFVTTYVDSLEKQIPDQLSQPRSYLNRLVVFTDNAIPNLTGGSIGQILRCSSYSRYAIPFAEVAESKPLKDYPNTSVLVVVTPARRSALGKLGFISADEQKELDRTGSRVFAIRRSPNSIAYVIVASTSEEALAGVQKIAGLAAFSLGAVP